MRLFSPFVVRLVLSFGFAPAAFAQGWGAAELAGWINDPELAEISGMAASRRHPGVLWVHNDSDDAPALYAVSERGERLARLDVEGVRNTDWEDLAAFTLDGRAYLLIADTGDNGGLRRSLNLHVVAEPARIADGAAAPAWSIAFRWPDGPRDCEAVAVDAGRGEILLIGKKRVPPDLFRLSLRPRDPGMQTAEPLGHLAGVVQPSAEDLARAPRFGRYRAQIGGADLSPDGRTLAVLNYRTVYLYRRQGKEGWGPAAARAPREVPFLWLPQAEAIAFGAGGDTLWLASEGRPSPLVVFMKAP